MIHAVFKDREGMTSALSEIKERGLGLSVTVSGLYKEVGQACADMGLTPHTVQYSLGVMGKADLLPEENVPEITTMYGHAMVSPRLLQHLLNRIRSNKMSHRDAALELSRQCECGIFNPERAERLMRNMTCVCPSTGP